MNTIYEISSLSSYRPDNGDMLRVFGLLTEDMTRAEALAAWRRQGKSDSHFRWVYKRLKERMLKGMLTTSFSEFEEHEKRRMECWRRFAEIKILLTADKRNPGIELAGEVMREAEYCGMVEVAWSLARDLAYQFGVLDVDLRRYRRYRRKVRLLWEELSHEKRAQELFSELGFLLHKKRDYEHLGQEVKAMALVESDSPRFNLFRYSLIALWHRIRGEHTELIKVCTQAIDYFEKAKTLLPYTSKWNFYRQMIPYLIAKNQFAQAESKIKKCLALPTEGSHNWHISMLQMAMLGFRSGKPKMAHWAWSQAMEHETESASVNESWEIVYAYLAIYKKLGQVELERDFRLARFINSVEFPRLSAQVAVMLHLLLDDNKKGYMKEADRVPDILRKVKSARGRCILRMLSKVEQGDYYKARVLGRVKRDWNTLKRTPKEVSINLIDDEIILFEDVWELVLERLR
ncbi:MAG TPA: hypothetical protein ENJ95_12970 [Bacteroidetes bacterium]|nr:hypothetical protein [Bacteroidota bacterium]